MPDCPTDHQISIMNRQKIFFFHDQATRALFALAWLALAMAGSLFVYGVVMRYFFNAPSTWSGEAVSYCLAVLIFAALPELTRQNAHISVDILPEYLPTRYAQILARVNALIATAACGIAGWIVAGQALKQFDRGLMTNAAHPIPRWGFTALIALGLIGAASHFARQIFAEHSANHPEK